MLSYNLIQTKSGTQIRTGLELLRRFGRYIRNIHRTQGEYDFVVELETKNETELRRLIKKHLHKFTQISRIKTMIAE